MSIPGLIHLANVYTETAGPGPDAGRFTTLAHSGLRCRLAHIEPGPSSAERVTLAPRRNLIFDPSYTMPPHARVEITNYPELVGRRWWMQNPTVKYRHGPGGPVLFAHVDVVEQLT